MPTSQPLNILIIGASISGPALATFLLLQHLPPSQLPKITLLERAPAVRTGGQNIDVRGTGETILQHLGVLDEVRQNVTGEAGVQLVDERNRVWAAFAAGRPGDGGGSPTAELEILRGKLASVLVERCRQVSRFIEARGGKGVEFVFGDYASDMTQDGDRVTVKFAKSGDSRKFDLVVGADGLQSSTRKMIWGQSGEEDRVKRLGMYGAFFSMPSSETDGDWRRWFHASGRRGIMLRPGENEMRTTVFMYVINEPDVRLREIAGKDGVQAQKEIMAEYFKDAGWESKRVVREMMRTDDWYYDLVGQVKLDRWSKGRVVLLGDAGYCASPISGMGTTLALNGAYNLAGALAQRSGDLETAFEQYERKMRPIVDKAQKLAPGMPHLINPETVWGVWMLNAMMWLLDLSGLVKLVAKFVGPPASAVPVEEYGLTVDSELSR